MLSGGKKCHWDNQYDRRSKTETAGSWRNCLWPGKIQFSGLPCIAELGCVRTLIVAAEGEKWPNVVERRREEIVSLGGGGGAAFRSANLAPFNGVDGLLLLLPREKC